MFLATILPVSSVMKLHDADMFWVLVREKDCYTTLVFVNLKGRRNLAAVPEVDARAFRKLARNQDGFQTAKMFRSVLASPKSSPISLLEIESDMGEKLDFDKFRVVVPVSGFQYPWQLLLPVTLMHQVHPFRSTGDRSDLSQLMVELAGATFTESSSLIDDLASTLCLRVMTESRQHGGHQYSPAQVLNCVLLSDQLKDLSCFAAVVKQCFLMALDPALAAHLLSQGLRVPAAATVYRHRLLLDLVAMVFSRRYFFRICRSPSDPESGPPHWALHLRADSSPQYGKDYYVVECDHIRVDLISESFLFSDMKQDITRRVLPLQLIGERAAGTEQSYSLAFDMGVESNLLAAPQGQAVDMIFPYSVPSKLDDVDWECVERKEVLDWVLPRRRPLEALRIHDLAVSHDLDECDVQFLTQLSHDAATSKLFWCMALLVEPIVGFGSHLSRWLHKCPCGCDVKDKCVLKGRRSIELACGKIDEFVGTLKNLTLSPFAIEAHKELKWQDGSVATQLLNEYETAKGKVHVSSMTLLLKQELLSYAAALLVLKGLEAKHHLVHQTVSRGRGSSVAAVSSELRRKVNGDLHRDEFQRDLPQLMESLGELTSMPWRTRAELVEIVSSQCYRSLHDDLTAQAAFLKRYRQFLRSKQTVQRGFDFALKQQHLAALLSEGQYYALPAQGHHETSSSSNIVCEGYDIFQVLSLNPGRRQYIQRAAHMASDAAKLHSESMESSLHEQNFPALLDAVHRIAEEAIESETLELRPTSPLDRAAVRWLSDEAELADGKMLLPAAVTTLTVLSHPSASQNADTAFGKRQCLLATGWTIAPSGRHASAKQKCLHGSQAESYYGLLLNFLSWVVQHEEAGWFSHSQDNHYYRTLLVAFQAREEGPVPWRRSVIVDICHVPLSMKVDFYTRLQSFLTGRLQDDPRSELETREPRGKRVSLTEAAMSQTQFLVWPYTNSKRFRLVTRGTRQLPLSLCLHLRKIFLLAVRV
ncbi:hypothetical protein AK812_SmicGene18471 [Symbiodinium microadriaticum]|uniref:Uncharacterized protein n=1 Tax=Symbiodinium microadriaticum TaxID=2951 RepID=A0A1Q9DV16_SYMMI|nr:hypothetical protein AK812_SmicGene18471 [Symbiodinium microadriaticum]